MKKKTSILIHPRLDLHGVKHEDVESLVENFVFLHQDDMPLEIIYGNSEPMKRLVEDCLQKIECIISSGHQNQYGRLLVVGYKN